MITLVKLARVATRLAKNPLVEVAFDATRFVVEALMIVALVVVELPMIAEVKLASVATRDEMNELVVVPLVTREDDAERRPVIDADCAERDDTDVVASTVWPETVRAVAEALLKVA